MSVVLIVELLRERVLFVTLILALRKLAVKKNIPAFRVPQVTVVRHFSMLVTCVLFSEW